jgi:predicted outer membrane repeat protein
LNSRISRIPVLLAVAALLTFGLAFAGVAHAATTYNVTTTDEHDDGVCDSDCSLNDAIDMANNDSVDSIINLPAGTYKIGQFDILNDGSFTITGAGAANTILDASETTDQFIRIVPTEVVTITGVTIENANAGDESCAAIDEGPSAALTLDQDVFNNNNSIEDGGAICVQETKGTTSLSVDHTTFTANHADRNGGAIWADFATNVTIADSTFGSSSVAQGNSAGNWGGAIEDFGVLSITNSTFSHNSSDTDQDGVGQGAVDINGDLSFAASRGASPRGNIGGSAELLNDTITDNNLVDGHLDGAGAAGGLTVGAFGRATVHNTILFGNTAPSGQANCSIGEQGATLTSAGHNIEGATDCGFTAAGDQQNTNPQVGTLADNGGPTLTEAITNSSAAFDKGDNSGCPATDQRGVARPQSAACDVGAFEAQLPTATPPAQPPAPVTPAPPAKPKIGVAGVRRACVASKASFRLRFHVAAAAAVKSVTVSLDGRRIKSTKSNSFTLTIRAKGLSAGRHRVTVKAVDSAGQTTTLHRSFAICRAVKPRRHVAPRFTG